MNKILEKRSYVAKLIAEAAAERQFRRNSAISLMRIAAEELVAERVVRNLEIFLGMSAIGIFTASNGREIVVQGDLSFKNPKAQDEVQLFIGKPHAPQDRDPSGNAENDDEDGKPKPIRTDPQHPKPLTDALRAKFGQPAS